VATTRFLVKDFVFNVATLVQETPGASRTYDVLAPREALNVPELVGAVEGQAQVVRLEGAVQVGGTFAAQVEQPCARCLEPAWSTIAFVADDDFSITEREGTADEEKPEVGWELDDRHNLDLSPLLTEGVISALPLMPVCRADCTGIVAGESLKVESTDPRWRELEELRDSMFPDSPPSGS
jgi:uncharacterized protein